jgi:LytS/YehU family sensor histidine kinase
LILQPLVENAIRHGIEPREDTGRAKLPPAGWTMLELKVSDNGPGRMEIAPNREGVAVANTPPLRLWRQSPV